MRSLPLSEIAPELVDAERSESHTAERDAIERELRVPPRRPADDCALFATLLTANKRGFITLPMPDGGQCLPVFTAPVRAADYTDVCLNRAPRPQYFVQSATGLLRLLQNPQAESIRSITLDRCPRCQEFVRLETHSLAESSDLITLWSIFQATKLARIEMYVGYALKQAQDNVLEVARQVAFEAVAHVAVEDPRPHLLLGQLAVALRDKVTLREAKAFLRLLKVDAWERQLDQDAASGARNFGTPGFFSKLQPETLWRMPRE